VKEVMKFSAAVCLAFIALAAIVAPTATPLDQGKVLAIVKGEEQRYWGLVVDARSTPEGSDIVIQLDHGGFIASTVDWKTKAEFGERVVLIQSRFGSSIERGR
jgi:hypothetical protein